MSAVQKPYVTPQEYLERERAAEYKSEYFNGRVYPMGEPWDVGPGSALIHGRILANVAGSLHGRLSGQEAQVFVGTPVVMTPYMPDVTIVSDIPQCIGNQADIITNPSVIVQVLSPSSEDRERVIDFASVRQISTLTDYVLIQQNQAWVEHYTRQGDGLWRLKDLYGPDSILHLSSVGCELPLSEIYARIEFALSENAEE